MSKPVERKVYAATLGAGAGTIVSDFALWGVDQLWWPSPEVDIPTPCSFFCRLNYYCWTHFLDWLAGQTRIGSRLFAA